MAKKDNSNLWKPKDEIPGVGHLYLPMVIPGIRFGSFGNMGFRGVSRVQEKEPEFDIRYHAHGKKSWQCTIRRPGIGGFSGSILGSAKGTTKKAAWLDAKKRGRNSGFF